jgi:hypothetical protein
VADLVGSDGVDRCRREEDRRAREEGGELIPYGGWVVKYVPGLA